MVSFILVVLLLLDLVFVPGRIWWEAIRGFFTPAAPPAVIAASQIGALAGFTALASRAELVTIDASIGELGFD